MNFLITECGLTPTIIAENPLVLTSDPYILKERCLFLQYYIENNGIPSSFHNFDFIRLKGKTTKGKLYHGPWYAIWPAQIPNTVSLITANTTFRSNNRPQRDRSNASWEFADAKNPR